MQKDNITVEQAAKIKEYNDVPVLYCRECMSLKIMSVDGMDYCDKCGSTNIGETHIGEWEKMYADKYAKPHINRE